MEVKPGFRTLKKCPFPLNRGVHSIKVTDTKIMSTFSRDQILSPINRDVPKESAVSCFCAKAHLVFHWCLHVYNN